MVTLTVFATVRDNELAKIVALVINKENAFYKISNLQEVLLVRPHEWSGTFTWFLVLISLAFVASVQTSQQRVLVSR